MKYLLTLISVLVFLGCTTKSGRSTEDQLVQVVDTSKYLTKIEISSDSNKLLDQTEEAAMIEEPDFFSLYDTVIVEDEVFFVVEGDLLYDIDHVSEYHFAETDTLSNRLVAIELNGELVKWPDNHVITYAVIRSSFDTSSEYEIVKNNMSEAISAWSNVCNVTFSHEHEWDAQLRPSQKPEELDFVVRHFNANNKFIAKAFFPNTLKYRRKILIDPSYYTSSYDKVGILRHELGHVIGFRHEHIRSGAPASCPKENTVDTRNLGDYDPRSVMHYFCGNEGTRDLKLTESDSIGAVMVYGPRVMP